MNNLQLDSIILINLFDLSFLTSNSIQLASFVLFIIGALAVHKFRVNKMKNLYAESALQVQEKNELLAYSIVNEQKARDRANIANREKSDLLARISREIRTPMNGVIGMASLLAETSLTHEQREYNETVRNCGESLLTAINDILLDDVLSESKAEVGGMEVAQKDFDLRNSIEEVLDVFAGKTVGAEVELLYSIDKNVPVHILGDSLRFRKVLMNLVENAVRFTRKGEIVVKAKVNGQDEDGLEIGFEVSDTGSGIPADKMSTLFKDVNQVNDSTYGKRGEGLGLAICKKMIASMGGTMKVESRLAEGTTIGFTIRVRAGLQSVSMQCGMTGQEGKKVLIVEDNLTCQNLLKDQLERWGLTPTVANSGKEALEILECSSPFDMVITDMRMPEMNGEEFAKGARQLFPQTPIVLLSAGEDSKQPGLFDSVVTKPIRQQVLCEHIQNGFRRLNKGSLNEVQPAKQKLSSEFSLKYPMHILIAEDNLVNQKLAMKVLGKLGYSPDIAQDGKEVLEVVSSKKYDLILMDVQMPEMDGLEATRMIRLCLDAQPVIIAMTANSMLGDREECMQAGMDDYISKPVRLEELVTMLEKWAEAVKLKR